MYAPIVRKDPSSCSRPKLSSVSLKEQTGPFLFAVFRSEKQTHDSGEGEEHLSQLCYFPRNLQT